MSVGRRLTWSLLTLVTCTALLGAAAIIGLVGLSHHYAAAEEEYEELRALYEVGHRAATVRLLLDDRAPDVRAVHEQLTGAAIEAKRIDARAAGRSIDELIHEAMRLNHSATFNGAGVRAEMNRVLGDVATLAAETKGAIVANRAAATANFRRVLIVMASLFGAMILLAMLVGVKQYRSIMRPLRALDRAVTRLGERGPGFAAREQGDREFRRLLRHFNRTSETLARLHESMHVEIEMKSRQLMRSEQLAGVGCLAAGIAHEINNPLGIIAGYAESTLKKLRAGRGGPAADREAIIDRAERTLEIVCDEAFRCRDITRDLLTLAQPMDIEPREVALLPLLERAIALVSVLPLAKEREILIRAHDEASELVCAGHPAGLLQVFINLLTNALEACHGRAGRVIVTLEREFEHVCITVADNGCGMSRETLRAAFDPFFTDKPKRGLNGCGLGLAISHAIIERHEGRLYAHSEGVNRGSTFTVELPAPVTAIRREGARMEVMS